VRAAVFCDLDAFVLEEKNENKRRLNMSSHSDAKRAKIDHPAKHYEKPGNIPGDKALSDEEKAKALDTWEQDARQLMTASNEGMVASDEGARPEDDHRFGEVVRAKAKIGKTPKPKTSH
jgi:hypothetical protein